MNAKVLAVLYLLGTVAFFGLPFSTSDALLQNIYLAAGSAFLAVLLGLIAVNLVLNSSERKQVAVPLLKLIGELAAPLHNELFIQLGRDTFGSEKFNALIATYLSHKGSPEAFRPEDLDMLFHMIMHKKAEISEIYVRVETTARDMASILGWSYDPRILRAVLSTRSSILSFTRLMTLETHDLGTKRKIVENYFDIEGAIGAWLDSLVKKVGVKTEFET